MNKVAALLQANSSSSFGAKHEKLVCTETLTPSLFLIYVFATVEIVFKITQKSGKRCDRYMPQYKCFLLRFFHF